MKIRENGYFFAISYIISAGETVLTNSVLFINDFWLIKEKT